MKVLCDVDGVLANFAEGASRLHGRPNPFLKAENFGNYSIEDIWGMSVEEFTKDMGYDYWINLPKMPDGDLIACLLIKNFGAENICILTKPTDTYGTLEGKRDWLNTHYPQLMGNWLIGPSKSFCSHSNSLLIDDSTWNCKAFQEEGGRAFLVPAAWNFKYSLADSPAWSLDNYINELRKQGLIL